MTLDEHIHKAEEDAKMAEFDTEWGIGNYFIDRSEALEYAKECRQLAEWLKDYKRLLEQEPCDKCVYSTKDGGCQYDDITDTIPPFEPCEDTISRQAALDCFTATKLKKFDFILYAREEIKKLPSVKQQTVRCKDCKWWKDSDGFYRRGVFAESKCPINRREVFEGDGYCFLFEPKMSEIPTGSESDDKCKNCVYYRNPDYTRCHECKAESEEK